MNPPTFATPLQGAEYMLRHGFHILPLRPLSKIPAVENWPEWSKHFTLEKLQNLPADYDGNFGVHPDPSGHFVLDIDCGIKNGKQGKGLESLAKLVEKHGPLPKTFTVLTPSGGMHLYFKGRAPNTIGQLGINIDSRGENGMVVAPGSVLPEGNYRIGSNGGRVEAPRWLIDGLQKKVQPILDRPEPDALDKPEHVADVIRYLKEAPICIEGENGDGQLFKVFCQCRDLGVSRETAVDLVASHYNPRCLPPWNLDDEADRIHFKQKATNAFLYAQNSPGAKTPEAVLASCKADFTVVPQSNGGSPPLIARDAIDLVNDASLIEPPILVAGMLHKGSTLLLGASSKSFKSWSLIDLAISVASGAAWWNLPCVKGRVLYADFELTPFFWRKRAMEIAQARGLTLDNIRVLNCRGHDAGAALLAIEREAKEKPFVLIILDPAYSFLAGKDENSAGDVGMVLRRLAMLAE